MRIDHQTTPDFTPVVITLENQAEVDRLFQIFHAANTDYNKERRMTPADDFLEAISFFASE